MSRQVLVLGTGRCGTSAIAGVLHWLGVHMGDSFVPADAANPYGTFEDERFLHMNRFIRAGLVSPIVRDTFYRDYVGQRNQYPLWGLKEPQLIWTLHYLWPLLDDVRIIIARRQGDSCIRSFMRAYHAPMQDAKQWYGEASEGLAQCLDALDRPTLEVWFPELLSNPEQEIGRIADFVFEGLERGKAEKTPAINHIRAGIAQPQKRPRVCISTPTKGNIRAETSEWRLRAFVQLAPDVEIQTIVTSKPLMHARNEQAQRFLATDCTHLFLLDADCVPQEQTIQRLLAYNLSIIAAPHPTIVKGEVGLMVVDRIKGGYAQHRPLAGLQGPNVVVGGSGLLIQRTVFEKLAPPWFRCLYDGRGLLAQSEDFYFCEKAHEAKYEIWADCDLPQRHIQTGIL